MTHLTKILMVPGLGGSEPEHWQTLWEQSIPGVARVEQANWDRPNRGAWIERLAKAVTESGPDVVLVGHSIGALTIVHWAARYAIAVRGAMLVAPTDLDAPNLPPELRGWAPTPMSPLPFPSIVVASSDDRWVTPARARAFADAWLAEYVDAGPLGHINSASGIGDWPQGRTLLESLREEY